MLDLQIENIKPGDEICTISKNGQELSLCTVGDFSQLHNKYRLIRDGKQIGLIPPDGAGYYAMHKKDTGPHFYYSANPIHIAKAEKQIAEAIKARQAKEKQQADSLQSLKIELSALLNKYGADLCVNQTSGDDQGVEFELLLSICNQSIKIG